VGLDYITLPGYLCIVNSIRISSRFILFNPAGVDWKALSEFSPKGKDSTTRDAIPGKKKNYNTPKGLNKRVTK